MTGSLTTAIASGTVEAMRAVCMPVISMALALVLLTTAWSAEAGSAPWRKRRRRGVRHNLLAETYVDISDWPAEPPSPPRVDPARFADALERICGFMPRGRPERYAEWILGYAREFGEDPFLIAALIHRLGRCRPDAEGMGGHGLTLISRAMYDGHIRRGEYRYYVKRDGQFIERTKTLDRFPFAEPRLRRAEENIYFTAALLSVWREQHASVDETFDQSPHRHYVSHFVWGDTVRTDRSEDRIFTDRRRLLEYYGTHAAPAPLERLGLTWHPPLDGAPRVVSSQIGDERDGGGRSHRGVDVESVFGEPVRAIASGKVVFSGVDLPGARANENLGHDAIMAVPRGDLGRGGRYVCIRHQRPNTGSLRSCYMHLEDVMVSWGDELKAGDVLGTVGRTGMKSSAPHLHLELHGPEGLMNPREVLEGHLIGRPGDWEEAFGGGDTSTSSNTSAQATATVAERH